MHVNPAAFPLRTAVLGCRVPLTPFAYTTSSTSFYQQVQTPQQTRQASIQITKASSISSFPVIRSTTSLKARRPQGTTTVALSPIVRNPSYLRTNSTASSSSAADESRKLDWNSFFKLRASRRRYSLASSIITSFFSTTFGAQILSTQDLESLGAQVMGLDPFIVLGLAVAACGAAGWLAGPFFGNAVWGMIYRRYTPAVAVKEKEFYDRIKRFRVDPSSNSMANPVPDYYGEKIGSVQGYRQWLKDQRAYNRKRRNFIA